MYKKNFNTNKPKSRTIGSIYFNSPKGEDFSEEIEKVFEWLKKKNITLSISFSTETQGKYEKYKAFTNGFRNKESDCHFVIRELLADNTNRSSNFRQKQEEDDALPL